MSETMKGKVAATNGLGSGVDIVIRAALHKRGLEATRDYTMIEAPFPAHKAILKEKKADLVVGSRYLGQEGSDASALGATREAGSRLANWLGNRVLKAHVTDPMSGFFMIRRELVETVAPALATSGFKVLFDILTSQKTPPRYLELPYEFRARVAGDSKLDNGVLTLTLDRPDRLNAMTIASQRKLHAALVDAARDPGVHVVVLTGSGKAFCAGYDLRDGMEGETEDPVAKQWSEEPIWKEVEDKRAGK